MSGLWSQSYWRTVAYTLKVYDLKGRLVCRNDTPLREQRIQLKGRPAGVYLLQLETLQGTLRSTLILR